MSNLKNGLQLIYNENRYRNDFMNNRNVLRNKLINGDMQFAQRGTSFSVPASYTNQNLTQANPPTYTLDRWFALSSQASKLTITQENSNSTPAPPQSYDNYMKIVPSSAPYTLSSGDVYAIGQYIDYSMYFNVDQGTSTARPFVLSFYANAALAGTYSGALSNFSTSSGRDCSYAFTYIVPSANEWHNFTINIDGCTIGTWDENTNLDVYFSLGSGSAAVDTPGSWTKVTSPNMNVFGATNSVNLIGTGSRFCITGIQLEQAARATPFQFLPVPLERLLCQNYYQQMTMTNGAWPMFVTRTNNNNGGALVFNKTFGTIELINNMISLPTVTFNSNTWQISGLSSLGNLKNVNLHTNFAENRATVNNQHASYSADGLIPHGGTLTMDSAAVTIGTLSGAVTNFNTDQRTTMNGFYVTVNPSTTTTHNFTINISNVSANSICNVLGPLFVWTPQQDIITYINAEIYPI